MKLFVCNYFWSTLLPKLSQMSILAKPFQLPTVWCGSCQKIHKWYFKNIFLFLDLFNKDKRDKFFADLSDEEESSEEQEASPPSSTFECNGLVWPDLFFCKLLSLVVIKQGQWSMKTADNFFWPFSCFGMNYDLFWLGGGKGYFRHS